MTVIEYPHKVTSNPYSFFEFQDDEIKLKEILQNKGIDYGRNHRLTSLYSNWSKKSNDVKDRGVTQVSYIEILTLLDLCEMNIIIPSLEHVPAELLRQKWDRLVKGTINRFEETESNSIARNTQFELLLYADLLSSGINCRLEEPNPDILIEHNGLSVNVQCKRIFNYSQNAVQRNVRKASRQLRADHSSNGNLGIIALSIERVFSGGNSFLQSHTQYSALEYVRQLHDHFYDDHKKNWASKEALGTINIPMLLFYTSTIARLAEGSPPFAHVTERDSMGTIPSDRSRKQFREIHRKLFAQ